MNAMSDAAHHESTEQPESPRESKRIHTKEEKEKVDEPTAEPLQSDEFGLPPRPPRRRQYTLNSLDSPEKIRQQVIEETDGQIVGSERKAESGPEKVTTKDFAEAEEDQGKHDAQADQKHTTPRQSIDNGTDLEKQSSPQSPLSPQSLRSAKSPASPRSKHMQQSSVNTISEWSHQQMAPQESVPEEKAEEEQWQEMPAYATHRIYDDWGKILAKEYDEAEDQTVAYGTLGGAGKGYTRVQMDEDAQSATSMDDNTAYLFNEGVASNALHGENDEESRDLMSQMQTTKELLTEGQKVAYVGVVRLSIASMAKDLDELQRTKHTKKAMDFAVESFKMWGQKIMLRLYEHMDIDSREQIMVEQLAEHGVIPSDLTPALMQNARVKNPNASSANGSAVSSARPSMTSPRPAAPSPATSKPSTPVPPSEPTTPSVLEPPPPAYEQHTADDLTIQNPDELENAKNIDLDIRWTVLCDLFLLLIADSTYDARSRTLLERVGSALSVEWQEICRFEKRVTDALEMQEQAEKENWNEDEHLEARAKTARNKRLMVMGLCTVGGGLVIGLSAGLLAPVIGAGLAAGFTAVGVTGTSTFLGGTGAAALIGTGGTLIGSRIGMKTSNRRTAAVKTYEYRPLFNNKRPNLIVTVAGWMTGEVDDVRLPFSTIDPVMGDIYCVNWEPEMLQSTGQTIQILGTEALTQTIQQIIGATVLSTLMAGLSTPIVLTKISYLIDNPWTTALTRGDATGLILADSIIDRNLGMRPITLVGFSLGARVIFSCLKELAKRGAVGLVQNIYMFGSPVVVNKDEYTKVKSIVPGRFVNAYVKNDWILAYLFRATSGGIGRVAGLASVDVPGIENIDVTEDVPGHMAYRGMMPILLDKVGWKVESLEYTEIEDPDPDNHERRQRQLLDEIEEARRQLEEKPEKKGFKSFFSRKKAPQKQAWETYDERSQKILEGDEKESERHLEETSNVMFDVDAIRKEALALALANPGDIEDIKKHLSVKEIQSTLPALKVTMPQESGLAALGNSSPSRPSLRTAQTHDGSSSSRQNGHASPAPLSNDIEAEDDKITLSFEDDRPETAATPGDWNDAPKQRFGASSSNEHLALRSVSMPLSSHDRQSPSSTPHSLQNPWSTGADADDPEFGKEAEMKMDFE